MKKSLLALVATAVLVNGERVIVQPGEPLPEMKDKDRDELLAAKAAREAINETQTAPDGADTADKAAAKKAKPGAG